MYNAAHAVCMQNWIIEFAHAERAPLHGCYLLMIINGQCGCALEEATAVNPQHHGGIFWTRMRRHHIDIQTIFRHRCVWVPHIGTGEVTKHRIENLNTWIRLCGRIQYPLPFLNRPGMAIAQWAHWGLCIRYAQPCIDFFPSHDIQCCTTDFSLIRCYYQRIILFVICVCNNGTGQSQAISRETKKKRVEWKKKTWANCNMDWRWRKKICLYHQFFTPTHSEGEQFNLQLEQNGVECKLTG